MRVETSGKKEGKKGREDKSDAGEATWTLGRIESEPAIQGKTFASFEGINGSSGDEKRFKS